jgi:hypothetical protein
MSDFQARTQARFTSICGRCSHRIKVGETIVQEENNKWSHAVCPGLAIKPTVETPCERTTVTVFDEEV